MKFANPEQFLSLLNGTRRPSIFMIFGDEPFIRNQTVNSIKSFFKSNGFSEFYYYDGENFNWIDLENGLMSFGLFSNQHLFCIDLTEKTPKEFTSNVKTLCEAASDESIIVIYGNHMTGTQEKTKWFSELANSPKAAYLAFYPPSANQLPGWFLEQGRKLNINLAPDAQSFMAINFEGNLSAGYQVLYNLYLQGITGNVSYEDLKKQTVAENHFTSDDFTAALAEKNSAKALRIIQNVREERVALKSFLWAVHRDLAVIVELKHPDHRGDFEIFKKYSVLIKFHQERLLKMAASIASAKHLNNLVKLFTRIDASVIREDYAWELLETYAVGFNNPAFLNGFIKNV